MTNAQILIVEDEIIVAENIRSRLKSLEYAVPAVVSSGEEAIQKAAETRPDLVLMDIKLEGDIDGVEAAEQIRARFDIPVVYLTAYADEDTLQRAKITEPFGYILKPFEVRELQTAIEVALYKHEMERRLKEHERWLATTLRSIGDAVIATDVKGHIMFMNPVAEALTGWKQEEAQSRDWAEVFNIMDEERRKVIENPATKAMQEGVVIGLVKHILIARDGTEIPIDDSAAAIRDDRGNITGAVLVFHDITERRRAEEALRKAHDELEIRVQERTAELAKANQASKAEIAERKQAEEALRERTRQLESRECLITYILDNIPSSLVALDRTQRVVSVNRNFLEKTRRGAQTTLGREIEEVFPQVLMKYTQLDQKIREVFRTGQPVEGGKLAYRAPGLPTRIYYYRLIPLHLLLPSSPSRGGAEVENVMLLMDDVTEREQLVEEVRRAERHLASVVECANDLVVSMDPQGHVVTWNRAAERVSGRRAERVVGQSLPSLCATEQRPVMAEMVQRLAHGEMVRNAEVDLLTADGQEVPIAWGCSPMRDDAGGVVGIVAVGRDLTERRRLEAQLIQSAKMASLGGMAGGIAHELRNPLGIISAGAQLLLERPDDARLRTECAQKIHAATKRASLIIENLLKFARPTSERMREMDLNAVLEETLALLAHQMTLQQVTVQKEFQAGLPKVYGNSDLLQQVFTNLLLNARNAMPQGGTLTVTTRATGRGQVEVQFSDTGQGIPPGNLPKIFDPFFTTMPVGKGIGLGLSISYSIIQQHQGSIEVQSQAGQGTTFTIRLPVNSR